MRRKSTILFAILATVLVLAGCAAQTKPRQAEPQPTEEQASEPRHRRGLSPLHMDGTRLVDDQGASVQLRGISTHGLAWFPQYVN